MENDNLHAVYYDSFMDTKAEAGKRLKAARKAKGMGLRNVSEAVGEATCGIAQLSNFEQGRRMISVEIAKELAPVLDVTPEYILTLTDTPKPDAKETELITLYRGCDARGKLAMLRTAQQLYQISEEESRTERRNPENDYHYSGPERRRQH